MPFDDVDLSPPPEVSSPIGDEIKAATADAEERLIDPIMFRLNRSREVDLTEPDKFRTALLHAASTFRGAATVRRNPEDGLRGAKAILKNIVDTLEQAGY